MKGQFGGNWQGLRWMQCKLGRLHNLAVRKNRFSRQDPKFKREESLQDRRECVRYSISIDT